MTHNLLHSNFPSRERKRKETWPSQSLQSSRNISVDIPIVDLSNPNEDLVARAVVKASETWGMFQVVNHGIPIELMRRLKELGTEFFELPEKEKEAVARPADSTDLEGYTTDYKKDGRR
ncbi:Flavonol synthase 3 [Raphanus sativus]|nr:Flavonol synthase 3 [Raphanus sativus]